MSSPELILNNYSHMGPPNEQNKSNIKPGFPGRYFILRGRDHYVQKLKSTMFYFNCVMGWVYHNHAQTCTTWRPVLKCPLPIRNHDGRLSIEESEAEDGAWWQQMVLFCRCLFAFSLVFLKSEKNNNYFYLSNISPTQKTLVFRFSLAGGLGS